MNGINDNGRNTGGAPLGGIAAYLKEREGVHEDAPGEYHAEIWLYPGMSPDELQRKLDELQPAATRFTVLGTTGFHRPETLAELEEIEEQAEANGGETRMPEGFMPLVRMRDGMLGSEIHDVDDLWDPWNARDMEAKGWVRPRMIVDTKNPETGEVRGGSGYVVNCWDSFFWRSNYLRRFVSTAHHNDSPGVYLLLCESSEFMLPVTDQSVIRWRSTAYDERRVTVVDVSSQVEEIGNLRAFGDFYDERTPLDEARADRTIRKYEEQLHRLIDEGSVPLWVDYRAL